MPDPVRIKRTHAVTMGKRLRQRPLSSSAHSDMVAEARARPSHHYTVEGADGTLLRGAASIAATLA